MGRANDFGGYVVDFSKEQITMEELFGEKNVGCGAMIATLWKYAREHGLISKTRPRAPRRLRKSDLRAAMVQPDA